jgi:enoyl-CoA hydratase
MTSEEDPHILYYDNGAVRTIVINRPQARNALSLAMRDMLCELLAEADQATVISAVVITGTDPIFTAGVDFKERNSSYDPYWAQFQRNPGRVIRNMNTPVICAINGPCVSGGLEMALSASLIVASDRASFADTHAQLGVLPKWGLSALLPRAVGIRMAREMSLTGSFIDAQEAWRLGLVNHVVAHEDLLEFTQELVGRMARTDAAVEVLDLYRNGEDLSVEGALSLEQSKRSQIVFDSDKFARAGMETAARRRRTVSGEV